MSHDIIIDSDESSRFTIEKDGKTWAPPVVTKVEANAVDEDTSLTDGCGNTETRTVAKGNWHLDAEGLLLKPDVLLLKEMRLGEEEAIITSEIESGTYLLKDISITQKDANTTMKVANRPVTNALREIVGEEAGLSLHEGLVFGFQIQAKVPNTGQGGSGGGVF